MDEYLQIGAVARVLRRSPETIREWNRRGLLPALRDPRTHNRLFKVADVERLAEEIVPREERASV